MNECKLIENMQIVLMEVVAHSSFVTLYACIESTQLLNDQRNDSVHCLILVKKQEILYVT